MRTVLTAAVDPIGSVGGQEAVDGQGFFFALCRLSECFGRSPSKRGVL